MSDLPPLEYEFETRNKRGMTRWIAGCNQAGHPPPTESAAGDQVSWSEAWHILLRNLEDELNGEPSASRREELTEAREKLIEAPSRQPFAIQTSCCSNPLHDYLIAWWIAPATA